MEKLQLKLCNLICKRKSIVENTRKSLIEIFIKFEKDSNSHYRVIRFVNEKLKFLKGFYLNTVFRVSLFRKKFLNRNLICTGLKVVENILKDVLEIFIEKKL